MKSYNDRKVITAFFSIAVNAGHCNCWYVSFAHDSISFSILCLRHDSFSQSWTHVYLHRERVFIYLILLSLLASLLKWNRINSVFCDFAKEAYRVTGRWRIKQKFRVKVKSLVREHETIKILLTCRAVLPLKASRKIIIFTTFRSKRSFKEIEQPWHFNEKLLSFSLELCYMNENKFIKDN